MDSKLEKLKKEAKKLGIELDANETIADLEAKIGMFKKKTKQPEPPKRGRVIKRINFTRRIDRETKDNG